MPHRLRGVRFRVAAVGDLPAAQALVDESYARCGYQGRYANPPAIR